MCMSSPVCSGVKSTPSQDSTVTSTGTCVLCHYKGLEIELVACRDDVVFHDDFLTLFPQYWAGVPPNYEYIAVGMIPRHFNVSKEAVYGGTSLLLLSD